MTSVLVHYSEIALKGKNRPWFVGRLVRNLHSALAGLHVKEVRTPMGRIEIVLGQEATRCRSARSADARLRHRRTIRWRRACRSTSTAWPTPIVSRLPPRERRRSFRVRVRRADQNFPTPSPDLARDLGSRVWHARGWKVDLDHADLVISVEIIPGAAFCYIGRRARARRIADGHRRPRGRAAVRRHRLAGRRVADDAARLSASRSCIFTARRSCRTRRRRRRGGWPRC